MRKPIKNADSRPRIHIRPMIDGVAWRVGITAAHEKSARTAGEAVDAALAKLGHAPAVIFYGEA